MKHATFYVLTQSSAQNDTNMRLEYSLNLARHFVTQGAKVYIHAQDKNQAEQLDELCFSAPLEQFIAHNLTGEGPKFGCPIEIGFSSQNLNIRPNYNRDLVINLSSGATNFSQRFTQVVDFVPYEKKLKQEARERYKIYRQAGFEIQTIELD